ncbi:methionyl-tRNA formyltransferase [Reichenbachiella faecimaris]|uniref:Methionyl-tRNA formyltransferase n=1 Tax=Reichenbachiella faecimaris TaxID=692418 RepID=A0A1W2GMI4_REIFA|nr:methionyl-tRNA formyltransferase [Reichenbachiella faecimaris]SMD37801.1 methionyl-tRNA formyltransferase [Reichenbachiella faecimaris]
MRIVFMGTPEFAVPSLKILHENGFEIVGVITAPDKPKGRGKKLQGTPVKEYAERAGLHVLQPTNLKSEEFLSELRSLKADLQIVVAFRMLPEVVWNMPDDGTFNLHGSLLPQYRGAAPINWALMNGETETGVTTFFLKHEIDTGSIILQDKEPIDSEDTVGDLYERLMKKGARLVLKTVQQIDAGEVTLSPQKESEGLKMAPKIHKETCEINWNLDSEQTRNFVRGLSPYPAAWTILGGKKFKVYKVRPAEREANKAIGEYETDKKTYLSVRTKSGWLDLLDLQMEGKKRMLIDDLLRGYKFD